MLLSAVGIAAVSSCTDDASTNWELYSEWRESNTSFYEEQKYLINPTGGNFYTTLVPSWNSGAEILIRYLNDRTLTEGNLTPMSNSTVNVKYIGKYYNGTGFDSSYLATDSVVQLSLSKVIEGWRIALQYMRVGDSVEIVVPYLWGYGSQGSGSIPPYSTLVFGIKLTDIAAYEKVAE